MGGMISIVVIVTENAPASLRGELTRWLLEVKPGVLVGNVSAMVRDRLWKKVSEGDDAVSALMIFTAANEQGFDIKMSEEPLRQVIDLEGIKLIKMTV